MNVSRVVLDYWELFRKTYGVTESFVNISAFGDSPELADELLELVLARKKTGTATLVIEMERLGEKMPVVGGYNVILDGRGKPAAIIRTTSVDIKPFAEVGEAFAYSEGEDDRTLESWRREHWAYWVRMGRRLGFVMKEELLVICENFELVYPE